jgi:hypothetical protein
LYIERVTGRSTRYFLPHSQESFTETKPALTISAVNGADICRVEVSEVGAMLLDEEEGATDGVKDVLKYVDMLMLMIKCECEGMNVRAGKETEFTTNVALTF